MKTNNAKSNNPSNRHGKRRKLKPFWRVALPVAGVLVIFTIFIYGVNKNAITVPPAEKAYESSVVDYDSVHSSLKAAYESAEAAADDSLMAILSERESSRRQQEESAFWVAPVVAVESEGDDHQAESETESEGSSEYSEDFIRTLVLAVQHEVGIHEDNYPNCESFDYLQRLMARVIVNRIGRNGFADTLYDVLMQKDQFPGVLDEISHYWDLPNANQFDPNDARTRANVMAVLNDKDGISKDLLFERCSLSGQSSIYEAWEYVKALYPSPTIDLYWYEERSYGGYVMFISNSNGSK